MTGRCDVTQLPWQENFDSFLESRAILTKILWCQPAQFAPQINSFLCCLTLREHFTQLSKLCRRHAYELSCIFGSLLECLDILPEGGDGRSQHRLSFCARARHFVHFCTSLFFLLCTFLKPHQDVTKPHTLDALALVCPCKLGFLGC